MIDELHRVDIEVFLDVVYNHTTESDTAGPCPASSLTTLLTMRSNLAISRSMPTTVRAATICGLRIRVVRRLVVDSLRYWVSQMGVDGFRFDIASIFTRNEEGRVNLEDPPIISEISGDPALEYAWLIAEPWQGEPGSGYMMGRAFPGKAWRQWNDHYRDTVRDFVRGQEGLGPALMARLYGSTDLLPDTKMEAFQRYQSVNYVDCHDGLNMCDLVFYKNDGQYSWNCGYEGGEGVPAEVAGLRRQQVKNFCCC